MKSIVEQVRQKVLEFASANKLFFPGERLVVGVSGGPDSVCLLHVLSSIKKEFNLDLIVAHVNHRLRGEESDADANYVRRLSKKMALKVFIGELDVKSYSKKRKISLEEAARELRYGFFADVLYDVDASCVAVAHTRDDDVETIIMHLLRGTGIAGLRGLQARSVIYTRELQRRSVNIIRPLLKVSRDETETYCRELNLKPCIDSSNWSLAHMRNRVRHELIPILKTYNPRIDEALLRLATIASEDMAYIEEHAAQIWSEIVNTYGGAIYLNKRKLKHLPGAIQRQLLRWSVKTLYGDTRDLELEHVEDMLTFINKPAGKVLHLPHGLRLHSEREAVVISRYDGLVSELPELKGEYSINVPGVTAIPGWLIKSDILGSMPDDFRGGYTAYFDLDKIVTRLYVRARRKGDVFQPMGMMNTKKLSRFMSDAKIPLGSRDRIPLVCADDEILWVVGWRVSEKVKISDSTTKILRVVFERRKDASS